jgi:hypothetical protein
MTAFDATFSNRNEYKLLDFSSKSDNNSDIFSNLPLGNRFNELRSLAPNSEQNTKRAESLIPKFEDVFDKFDYDKDSEVSKEEVQKAMTDESLKPHEQKMARLVNDNYDTIKPMGSIVIVDRDQLDKRDFGALDSLGKYGITWGLAFNYGNSIAETHLWKAAAIGAGGLVGNNVLPAPWSKYVGVAGQLVSLGYGLYGIGKGVHDYYSAKPELERIRGEIRNITAL